MNATAWSRGLEVTGGGTGVVSHAGLVLLRQLADRTGLTAGLSAALPSPDGGLDRGRVFADLVGLGNTIRGVLWAVRRRRSIRE